MSIRHPHGSVSYGYPSWSPIAQIGVYNKANLTEWQSISQRINDLSRKIADDLLNELIITEMCNIWADDAAVVAPSGVDSSNWHRSLLSISARKAKHSNVYSWYKFFSQQFVFAAVAKKTIIVLVRIIGYCIRTCTCTYLGIQYHTSDLCHVSRHIRDMEWFHFWLFRQMPSGKAIFALLG